jgi:hypothetical protein
MEKTISLEQKKNIWQSILVLIGVIILVDLAAWMIHSQVVDGLGKRQQIAALASFEEETGIRILRVAMTAGGGMVDIQYQVVDPDKALIVHDDDNPPRLLDEESGQIIGTPFHDHSFQELHTAVTYHEIMMNGGRLLERGSKITLNVGDSVLKHLVVE